eukprot:473623_1
MSDLHNNHVIQTMSPVADRQSAAKPIFNANFVHPNPIIIPPMQPIANIISTMPPPPPPAAFQLQPKLNPSAPSFNPSTPSNVQGYNNQLELFHQQLQVSMAKLQLYSIQLNAFQIATQQNPSAEALQQYQTVYQQYNLEFTNTLLLNQCIQNLSTLAMASTNPTTPSNHIEPHQSIKTTPNGSSSPTRLETIEEGEDEEVETDDEIAPIAGIATGYAPKTEDGNDDEGVYANKAIGEQLIDTFHTKSAQKFEKFQETPNYGLKQTQSSATNDTETRGIFGEREEQKVSELEKIKKQIRGILNKMTADNFDKLSQEMARILNVADMALIELKGGKHDAVLSMKEIVFAQKAQFKALIKLILKCILERAMTDVIYMNQYARLVHTLSLCSEHKNEFDELKKKLLRQQLLSLCNSIFNKARNAQDKVRFLGIVTMIGELYRFGLISWNVILSGIFNELLPPQTPLDIEAVCKLLKTAGNEFDRQHYKEINVIIDQLSKCGQRYDFRTRCFVKEIQEIRGTQWKVEVKKPHAPQQSTHRWRSNSRYNNAYHNRSRYNDYNSYNPRKRMKTRPAVEFLRDVTLPDRSHYAPNKTLTKTWAMRNSGDLAWGDNVELVYFKGDERLSVEHRYPVMNVCGGQEVEISATIKTPSQPGRYCTYFRLQKNGKFFGPRVWVDIIVNDLTNACVSPSETKLIKSESNHRTLQCP